MLAAAERTLSSGEYDLLERVIGATTTEEMQEDIETFNALKAGVPDTEESLAERESTVSFSVRSGNTLRIARSTRGVFQLSIAGAN
jgi:hypothetical protein